MFVDNPTLTDEERLKALENLLEVNLRSEPIQVTAEVLSAGGLVEFCRKVSAKRER